jgi:hypothetical protein
MITMGTAALPDLGQSIGELNESVGVRDEVPPRVFPERGVVA